MPGNTNGTPQVSAETLWEYVQQGSEIGRGWAETIGNIHQPGDQPPAASSSGGTTVTVIRDSQVETIGTTGKIAIGGAAGAALFMVANKSPLWGLLLGAAVGWAATGGADRLASDSR